MDCKYSRRETVGQTRNYIYCDIANERCIMTRYCGIVNDIINIDGYMNKCKRYIDKEESMVVNKETPNKVLFEKRGKLYIETNDEIGQVVALDNPFDNVPKAVCLVLADNNYYIKGYEPKKVYKKVEVEKDEKKRN